MQKLSMMVSLFVLSTAAFASSELPSELPGCAGLSQSVNSDRMCPPYYEIKGEWAKHLERHGMGKSHDVGEEITHSVIWSILSQHSYLGGFALNECHGYEVGVSSFIRHLHWYYKIAKMNEQSYSRNFLATYRAKDGEHIVQNRVFYDLCCFISGSIGLSLAEFGVFMDNCCEQQLENTRRRLVGDINYIFDSTFEFNDYWGPFKDDKARAALRNLNSFLLGKTEVGDLSRVDAFVQKVIAASAGNADVLRTYEDTPFLVEKTDTEKLAEILSTVKSTSNSKSFDMDDFKDELKSCVKPLVLDLVVKAKVADKMKAVRGGHAWASDAETCKLDVFCEFIRYAHLSDLNTLISNGCIGGTLNFIERFERAIQGGLDMVRNLKVIEFINLFNDKKHASKPFSQSPRVSNMPNSGYIPTPPKYEPHPPVEPYDKSMASRRANVDSMENLFSVSAAEDSVLEKGQEGASFGDAKMPIDGSLRGDASETDVSKPIAFN